MPGYQRTARYYRYFAESDEDQAQKASTSGRPAGLLFIDTPQYFRTGRRGSAHYGYHSGFLPGTPEDDQSVIRHFFAQHQFPGTMEYSYFYQYLESQQRVELQR